MTHTGVHAARVAEALVNDRGAVHSGPTFCTLTSPAATVSINWQIHANTGVHTRRRRAFVYIAVASETVPSDIALTGETGDVVGAIAARAARVRFTLVDFKVAVFGSVAWQARARVVVDCVVADSAVLAGIAGA